MEGDCDDVQIRDFLWLQFKVWNSGCSSRCKDRCLCFRRYKQPLRSHRYRASRSLTEFVDLPPCKLYVSLQKGTVKLLYSSRCRDRQKLIMTRFSRFSGSCGSTLHKCTTLGAQQMAVRTSLARFLHAESSSNLSMRQACGAQNVKDEWCDYVQFRDSFRLQFEVFETQWLTRCLFYIAAGVCEFSHSFTAKGNRDYVQLEMLHDRH